jgi:hypothetical protein
MRIETNQSYNYNADAIAVHKATRSHLHPLLSFEELHLLAHNVFCRLKFRIYTRPCTVYLEIAIVYNRIRSNAVILRACKGDYHSLSSGTCRWPIFIHLRKYLSFVRYVTRVLVDRT